VGCSYSHKDPPRGTHGTIKSKIGCQSFPCILGEREPIPKHAFPSHSELSGSPVDIVQFQGDHLPGSKPQACEEKKYRMISSPNRSRAIAGVEKTFYLLKLEVFGHIS
jgi:hypothetical protein